MSLPSFTITGTLFDLLGNTAAGAIVGNGLGGATPATVTFTSNVPTGYFVTFGGAAYRVDAITADVNSDGTITRNGEPVLLLANDDGLSVDGVQWQAYVTGMKRFWFNAPVDGGTVDLDSVVPVPGIGVSGVAFSEGELITLLANSGSSIREALDALYGPGAVDEYHPYANLAAFPATGVTDRLYLAMDTGKLYRWTGSVYLQIADKAAVGLGNVDNTSDVNKPISTLQQTALNTKAKRLTYLVDDYGTVDYTGATASDTAVAAARTAMGTGPGVLAFGTGVVRLNSPISPLDHPGQGFEGRGNGVTRIDYRGTGDCFRAWDSTQVMDGAHGPHQAGPMTGLTIDLSANANTNTCGLHIGDLFAIFIDDVVIIPAVTAGSKAFWNHNTYSWSERAFIRFNVLGSPTAVGDQVVFSGDDAHPLGHTSMSYSTYFITVDCENANQRGVVWEKNAAAAGVFFSVTGNFHGGVSSNSGVALTVGTSPSDACFIRGVIQVNAETIGAGAFGYKDINVAAASLIEGTGSIDFQNYGSSSFAAGTATGGTVRLSGYKHCPSLKASYEDIQDAGGNVLLRMQAQANALNYLGIGNRASGNPPKIFTGGSDTNIPILLTPKGNAGIQVYKDAGNSTVPMVASGDDANVGWDFQTQGTAGVTVNGSPTLSAAGVHAATSKTTPVDADELAVLDSAASFGLKRTLFSGVKTWIKSWIAKADVGLGNVDNTSNATERAAVRTLTNATLTLPVVDAILDASGNYQLRFQSSASAANYVTVVNRAAGNPPYFAAAGSDTNIPVAFIPKGTAGFYTYSNNAGVTAIPFVVNGDATNVGLDVQTQGTERLRENGNITASWVSVPATATSTGKVGQQAVDSSWLYICTATNTWRRVAIAAW